MPPEVIDLSLVHVFGRDGGMTADEYARLLKAYDITSYAWNSFAQQPNLVEVYTPPKPKDETELHEVTVTADYEPGEEIRYNEETGVPYPPSWQMNDQEYAESLGGGDSAYEQVWRERHPEVPNLGEDPVDEDDEAFTTPTPKLNPWVKPPIPKYVPKPAVPTPKPFRTPWTPPPRPVLPYEIRPPIPEFELPGIELVQQLLPKLGRIILGPFLWLTPQSMGPRILDEAPPWWELPPAIAPKPRKVTPLPVFDEPEPVYAPDFQPEPVELPDPGFRRFVQPIGDPGVFADPAGLPDFPSPDFKTTPEPRTRPFPDWATPEPYRPTFPDVFTDPWIFTPTKPGVPPRTDAPPRIADPLPRIDLPPRTGDPLAPPDLFTDPFTPTDPNIPLPYFLPQPRTDVRVPVDVFTLPPPLLSSPLLPPFGRPELADPCKCKPCKKEKKKKKKKSTPRAICYEGHYVEHSRGLTKVRGKQIPCDSKAAKVPRAPRRKAPGLPDLARDVFGF